MNLTADEKRYFLSVPKVYLYPMIPESFVKQITFTHPKVTQCLCKKLTDGAESVAQE